MTDEMYLQKTAQYQNGDYGGVSDDRDLFKGKLLFMIVGLKELVTCNKSYSGGTAFRSVTCYRNSKMH